MSGAVVWIGLNSPRYSTGACGLRSHISMCDAPPQRKKSTVERAGLRGSATAGASAASAPGRQPKPASANFDALRNVLRFMGGRNWKELMAEAGEGRR